MVYFSDDDIRPCVDWHEGFEEGLERGLIVKADTLDELAQKLGINAEGLKQTVEDYNAPCAAGEDTQYGKDPGCLYPVLEPPFYGCERMPGIAWGVNGGVAIDMHGRVLTSTGEVIDGLYCGAGDGSMADGNTMEPMEQSVVPGGAHYALTMGYIAANAAIDDILAATSEVGTLVETPQDREPEELAEAEKLMNERCAVCHSVPTPADFAGKDLEGATGLLTDNHDGMDFDEADARVIAAWAVRG